MHKERKFLFELPENNYGDFPFYNRQPINLSPIRWILWVVITIIVYLFATGQTFFQESGSRHIAESHPSPLFFIFQRINYSSYHSSCTLIINQNYHKKPFKFSLQKNER